MPIPNNRPEIMDRMIRKDSYHRLYEVRALDKGDDNKMIIEGKAVTFGDKTVLFKWGDQSICEIIDKNAFKDADMSDVFLKYNHSEDLMVLARTKSQTLSLEVKEDGLYMRAELADTTGGRDLYELIRRGDIDKMSFAFSIEKDGEEKLETDSEITFTVKKIRKLYDVAAVPLPAYENTNIYARRLGEVETRQEQVEAEKRDLEIRRIKAKTFI